LAGGVERPGAGGGGGARVGWGVAADRTGPDRVGSRARRSGAAARAALARGRGPSSGGRRRLEGAGHDRPTASDRVSGLFGSCQILSDVACQVRCNPKVLDFSLRFSLAASP
jgi:hypothetical protein